MISSVQIQTADSSICWANITLFWLMETRKKCDELSSRFLKGCWVCLPASILIFDCKRFVFNLLGVRHPEGVGVKNRWLLGPVPERTVFTLNSVGFLQNEYSVISSNCVHLHNKKPSSLMAEHIQSRSDEISWWETFYINSASISISLWGDSILVFFVWDFSHNLLSETWLFRFDVFMI